MRVGLIGAVCGLFGLVGCAGGAFSGVDGGSQHAAGAAGAKLTGAVHGGQNPIGGAHVYLLAAASGAGGAGQAAYGGNGIAASASNASVSLLTKGTGQDGGGNYYMATGSDGSFTISGDYTCAAGQQIYLYAVGGDPGLGTGVNPAAGLMAALGSCPVAGTFSSGMYVVVNEVSTVAAAYAMAGFATDATHVGSSGTALALTGIANAFANATNLADLPSGTALATTPPGNGTVPQAEINTLANILASCVNSAGASSSACSTLFANAMSGGTTGTVAADTATAAINIAHNPGAGLAALYGLASGTPPFGPGLSSQPNDWTVILLFGSTGGFLGNSPGVYQLAIDGSGNAWMLPQGSGGSAVFELSPAGTVLSPSGGYTAGGIFFPAGLAIDVNGNAWTTNPSSNPYMVTSYVTELTGSGIALSPANGFPLNSVPLKPVGIAFDGTGNAWTSFALNHALAELSSTGTLISPLGGFTSGSDSNQTGWIYADSTNNIWGYDRSTVFKTSNAGVALSTNIGGGAIRYPTGIAFDHSNNAWISDQAGAIFEFDNSGALISPPSGYTGGGLTNPFEPSVDGAGNVWVGNYNAKLPGYPNATSTASLSEFSNSGMPLSPSTGFTLELSTIFGTTSIAIDGSGNIWETNIYSYPNYFNYQVAEYVGAAAPVVTPLSVGVKNNTLGTRP